MSNDTVEAFRDSARDFLVRSNTIKRLRALREDQASGLDRAAWRELANVGWPAVLVAEKDGGLGLDLRAMSAIAEEVGQHLLPEPYIAGAVQVAVALSRSPQGGLRSALLEQLCAGELIAGLAWQEQLGELEASWIQTEAVPEGGDYLLDGLKKFVAPGAGADGWLVLAHDQAGPVLAWVPADTAGVSAVSQQCMDGSVICELSLNQVRIPASHILATGMVATHAISDANNYARIVQSAELLGVMRHSLAVTLEYLNTRKQFGRQIGSFQALKHRAVDAYIQVELSSACLNDVLGLIEQGGSVSLLSSRAKARCASAALLVSRMAIQFHGAMGYTDECDVGLYFKRALHLSTWLGNVDAHRKRYFEECPQAPDENIVAESDPFPKDADWDNMSEADFRKMLKGFYAKNYPQHLRNVPRRLHWHEIKDWYMTLSRQGWVAPSWPKQFGGMGLSPAKMIAYVEEQEEYGVARAPDMGVVMIGPLLIQRGNTAQQQKFLPKIISGEHIWCQGYSEPGAGSDLAALRTTAIADGNEFVVNGQKIWTTLAQDATHMFALVRTDQEAKKQSGISFLLIDLDTPGITIRKIKDIGGYEEFCEVFLDNVRVPAENLVGEMNQGWTIAKALLGFERIFLGSPKQSRYAFSQLSTLAQELDLLANPVFAAKYAELMLDVADLVAAYTHFAEIVKRGEVLPASVSLLKIWATDTYQRICMLLVDSAQEHGGTGLTSDFGPEGLNVPAILFNAIPSTIYGGSTEIQKEIISKNVLRLPD